MSFSLKEVLKHRLKQPLPGIEAQYEMAHIKRARVRPEDLRPHTFRKSAVLIILYERDGRVLIPLTERHPYKGVHSAQVSFPGGKFDEHDGALENTALRECWEEIGISEGLELLGALTPVYIPVSNFIVHPFVAFYTGRQITFNLNEREVKALVELEIDTLKNPATFRQTNVEPSPGMRIETPYFDVNGKVVWGATAMILNEFRHILLESEQATTGV
jgi:8-oxo-dGTP pyrophosphatase MutT (NUDIX family)